MARCELEFHHMGIIVFRADRIGKAVPWKSVSQMPLSGASVYHRPHSGHMGHFLRHGSVLSLDLPDEIISVPERLVRVGFWHTGLYLRFAKFRSTFCIVYPFFHTAARKAVPEA